MSDYRCPICISFPRLRYAYAAELAGLGYSLANTKSGITLAVKGYSDKQGVLLDKVMDRLTSCKEFLTTTARIQQMPQTDLAMGLSSSSSSVTCLAVTVLSTRL